jgi:hypothetical protein
MAKKEKEQQPVIRHRVKKGDIIGYKKIHSKNSELIATLFIPADASAIMGDAEAEFKKCRASKALVVSIVDSVSGKKVKSGVSGAVSYASGYRKTYKVGQWVYPDNFDTDTYQTCSSGIHFFISRKLAEKW